MDSEFGGPVRLIAVVLAVAAYLALSGWLLLCFGLLAAFVVLLCGLLFGTGTVVVVAGALRRGMLAPADEGRGTASDPRGGYVPPGYLPAHRPGAGQVLDPDRPGPDGPLAAHGSAGDRWSAQSPRTSSKIPPRDLPPDLPRELPQDPAWPRYTVGQWRADLVIISVTSIRFVAGQAWRAHRWLVARPRLVWIWPLPVAGYLALPGIAVGLLSSLLLMWTTIVAVVGTSRVMGAVAAAMLMTADGLHQKVSKSQASCPECYAVIERPAFRCPGCAQIHHHLRPGRWGVFHRRCTCGKILPTTVGRASRRMTAVCPYCRVSPELPRGAGNVTDVRIPVFGPVSAGKSRLIMAGLVDLEVVARAGSVRMEFVDESSRRSFGQMQEVMSLVVPTIPKTQEAVRPRPCTFTLAAVRRQAMIHLFDAAGERYIRRDRNADLAYLDGARTLVFVLDPFSIPSVRAMMTGALGDVLHQAWAAEHDPYDAYNSTATRLRDYGVPTRRQRLAFVVSKADLLLDLPFAEDLNSEETSVKAWLERQGLDRLLRCAERDFGTVRYFLVSSLRSDPGGQMSAARPLLWLMRADGFVELQETGHAD